MSMHMFKLFMNAPVTISSLESNRLSAVAVADKVTVSKVLFERSSLKASRMMAMLIIAGLVVFLTGCDKKQAPEMPVANVTISVPTKQKISEYLTFDGTLAATQDVNLVARVSGYLDKILFKDGDPVKKNDLLFVIEQEQYIQEVKLNQAIYNQTKAELERQTKLLRQNATSQAAVDQALSNSQQASANLRLAQINLSYTEVRAPFDGLMGRHLIDVGNFLPGGGSGVKLASIQMVSPIYVYFALNEIEVLKYLKMTATETNLKQGVTKKPVFAKLQTDKTFKHKGLLDFAANELNTSTGALQVRGEFKNADISLLPGLYATVLLEISEPKDGLLVLNSAVLSDQLGDYVFVVGADKKAARQNITVGQQHGPLVAVTEGLKETDQVVMNGFITLSPGQTVNATAGKLPEPIMPALQ
jgi:multidrug efflux system membrane fusion protein